MVAERRASRVRRAESEDGDMFGISYVFLVLGLGFWWVLEELRREPANGCRWRGE